MATAQRDEGLDKLEAFIALLDATHDRLEDGAERLEAAAEQLEEHEDDLDDLAGAITRGGEGAIAMAITATTALAGVTSDSESEEDPIVARLTALAELATALQVYVKDIVTGDVAEDLQAQEKEELDRLAATLVRLQAMASQLREHLLVLQERELETTRQKEKELQAAACVKVWAIALAVAVTIVAVVVAVFTLGSTLLLFAAVALAVVACVGALVQAMLIVIENLPALLRAMGFDEHADAMAEWMDEDWFKWACTAVMVATVIAALIGSLGAALSVATVVLALSVPLTIATCVVANVARLLSALNPFD